MPSILKNLERIHVAVVVDKFNTGGHFGDQLSKAAVLALTEGFGSPEWTKYMSLFAVNKEQLSRLTEDMPGDDPYFKEARAYIVANAICGAGTTGQTGANVKGLLEQGIEDKTDPDDTVAPPFAVPAIL